MPAVQESTEASAPLPLVAPGNGKVLAANEKALVKSGLAKLSKSLVNDMRKLGVDVSDAGIVHTDLGYAFATKAALFHCVQQLDKKVEAAEAEELHLTAASLSKLAKAVGLLAAKNFSADDLNKDKPTAPRKSFAAGATVIFHGGQHVHQKPA